MKPVYQENKTFDANDYTVDALPKGEYSGCTFTNCNFSEVNLIGFQFFDCVFNNCNMSNAVMKQTVFREVKMNNCKLMGIRFDECNTFLFSPQFDNCILLYASFYKLKMKGTNFINCNAGEVDFTEADLSQSSFTGTDLALSQFEATNLEGADLRTAINYNINPLANNLKKAKFSWPGLMGLLGHWGIEVDY